MLSILRNSQLVPNKSTRSKKQVKIAMAPAQNLKNEKLKLEKSFDQPQVFEQTEKKSLKKMKYKKIQQLLQNSTPLIPDSVLNLSHQQQDQLKFLLTKNVPMTMPLDMPVADEVKKTVNKKSNKVTKVKASPAKIKEKADKAEKANVTEQEVDMVKAKKILGDLKKKGVVYYEVQFSGNKIEPKYIKAEKLQKRHKKLIDEYLGEKENKKIEIYGKDEVDDMEADEFVVEKVVDKSFYNGKYYYEVKWEGWDSKDNSWLQKKDLQGCEELIDTYEKSDAGLKFAQKLKGPKTLKQKRDDKFSVSGSKKNQTKRQSKLRSEIAKEPVNLGEVLDDEEQFLRNQQNGMKIRMIQRYDNMEDDAEENDKSTWEIKDLKKMKLEVLWNKKNNFSTSSSNKLPVEFLSENAPDQLENYICNKVFKDDEMKDYYKEKNEGLMDRFLKEVQNEKDLEEKEEKQPTEKKQKGRKKKVVAEQKPKPVESEEIPETGNSTQQSIFDRVQLDQEAYSN